VFKLLGQLPDKMSDAKRFPALDLHASLTELFLQSNSKLKLKAY